MIINQVLFVCSHLSPLLDFLVEFYSENESKMTDRMALCCQLFLPTPIHCLRLTIFIKYDLHKSIKFKMSL